MDDATFAIWRVDRTDVVQVRGVLDLSATVRLRLTLFGRLDAGATRIVVDLSGVRLLDASSVNVLVQVADRLHERHGHLLTPGARGIVLEVLEIADVAKKLGAYDQLDPRLADRARDNRDDDPAYGDAAHGLWGDEVNALVARIHRAPPGDPARQRARDEAIAICLPHAERLAHRFYGLGEPRADLNQVAALGLLKAIDRYDPALGTDFASYATPTVVGELKRHFRDRGWTVRVPRRIQELRLDIRRARADLTHELGRTPTVADIAERLDVDESDVDQADAASTAYHPASLNAPLGDRADTLLDTIAEPENGYARVDDHESLKPLIAALPRRERDILLLRYFGNLTQSQIATRLGISQMHVSRLLSRTLVGLRAGLLSGS